jgi:hypothetical protein
MHPPDHSPGAAELTRRAARRGRRAPINDCFSTRRTGLRHAAMVTFFWSFISRVRHLVTVGSNDLNARFRGIGSDATAEFTRKQVQLEGYGSS